MSNLHPSGGGLCYHEIVRKPSLAYQGRQFVRHVVPEVLRPARTLWHEVIGFLFLALAALPIPSAVREVRSFDGQTGSIIRMVLTVLFVAIMGGYGISSFRRARKISRS
jgi:hypothetical protein